MNLYEEAVVRLSELRTEEVIKPHRYRYYVLKRELLKLERYFAWSGQDDVLKKLARLKKQSARSKNNVV